MSKLSAERAIQILKQNRELIYHLPAGYPAINHYLGKGKLRETLLKILHFLQYLYESPDNKNHLIIDNHRYEFFLSATKLSFTVRGIRHESGRSTANRHINLLCALGIFRKIQQTERNHLRINDNLREKNPNSRYLNVYSFRELDQAELEEIESRAERLKEAGITTGNMSFRQLQQAVIDLSDIAQAVYPERAGQSYTEAKEYRQYQDLIGCIDLLIDSYGYASKALVKDNLTLPEQQIDKLFRLYKVHLKQRYRYKRPNREEQEHYQLQDSSYIFSRKEQA